MPTLADLLRSGSWDDGSSDNTRQLVNALRGAAETGMTLGSGALAGLAGMPYGIYKGITSGAYGTSEAPRIAAKEAQQFMERNTYQPRTEQGQEYVQKLGRLFEESKLPPVMPEAALLGAIPKQAYAAQAERAGMAAEKALEPAIMRTMERGGKPAQLLQDLTQGTKSPLDVWHGSPHRFEKFDASKIGTGEGAQSYGHGLYFAESPDVAKSYRDKLTTGENYVNGEILDPYNPQHYLAQVLNDSSGNVKEATEFLQTMALPGGSKSVKETALAALDLLKKGEKPLLEYVRPEGSLYKVDLPDEKIAQMIDWDKPIKDQPEALSAIRSQINDAEIERSFNHNVEKGITGANAMQNYVWGKTPAERSEALRQIGIPGIRYLDEQSRDIKQNWVVNLPNYGGWDFPSLEEAQAFMKANPHEGMELIEPKKQTSNFVVFPGNEDLLKIMEINGQPVNLGAYK